MVPSAAFLALRMLGNCINYNARTIIWEQVHMKTNHVREKAKAGKPTIGCFLGLGSPNVAGLMANAGLDWVVIETEHNGLDSAEIEHMLRAIDGTETVPMVRVPSASGEPNSDARSGTNKSTLPGSPVGSGRHSAQDRPLSSVSSTRTRPPRVWASRITSET